MALCLGRDEMRDYRRLVRTLLSPPEMENPADWCAESAGALSRLFGTESALFFLPLPEDPCVVTRGMGAEVHRGFEGLVASSVRGKNRYRDPVLDQVVERLRRAGLKAWSTELAERISRIEKTRIPFYEDVLRPGGLAHMHIVGAPVAHGEARLAVFHERPDDNPFGQDALELAHLLQPAFEAGLRSLEASRRRARQLGEGLERVGAGMALFTAEGRELYRNDALRRFAENDPAGGRLLTTVEKMSRRVARVLRTDWVERSPGPVEITTGSDRYLVSGSITASPDNARPAVLVTVERVEPVLPSAERLQEWFGLTERQATVAILLAEGKSNADIATSLGISPHTVRNHASAIYDRMGVESRKALGLFLVRYGRHGPER